jgi:glycosyltransferase involved in cell wall biosynthesis
MLKNQKKHLARQCVKGKISIVIPMYNEEKSIGWVLGKIPRLENYEVLLVNDGSRDNSVAIAQQFPNVSIINHETNMGYGATLLDGIFRADGEFIVTLDSDGQHDPRDIPNLLSPLIEGKAEVVVGSRYLGGYNYQLPLATRIGEAFLELALWVLFGVRVTNNQGGFRAFKFHTKEMIFDNCQFVGFAFATENLIKARLGKYQIVEAPVRVYNRQFGKSRIKSGGLLISLIHCLIHYKILQIFGGNTLNKVSSMARYLRLTKASHN